MRKQEMDDELRKEINQMDHETMARLWRFEPAGSKYFIGEASELFMQRFMRFGGMTPELSKRIGWENEAEVSKGGTK